MTTISCLASSYDLSPAHLEQQRAGREDDEPKTKVGKHKMEKSRTRVSPRPNLQYETVIRRTSRITPPKLYSVLASVSCSTKRQSSTSRTQCSRSHRRPNLWSGPRQSLVHLLQFPTLAQILRTFDVLRPLELSICRDGEPG